MPLVAVGPLKDIPPGEIKAVTIPSGDRVALFNVEGQIYATADTCTHGAASLAEDGMLDGNIVECSWHFGRFDVTTGEACGSPCSLPLKIFRVEIVDGIVNIEV